MIPYEEVKRLVGKYGVANVLLMVSDVIEEQTGYMGFDKSHRITKFVKAGQVIRKAVRELPKTPGIK